MQDTLTQRPDDCECWGQTGLPCFPCYLNGYTTPNTCPELDQ